MHLSDPAPEVAALLADPSPLVRALAARLVGKLDLAQLRRALERLAGDESAEVRAAAAKALARLRPSGGRGSEILLPHGGYASLKAHQAADIVYDATVAFCNRFVGPHSRTRDQMVQAARSGKHIVKGSVAAGTSSKTVLRLVGVARASLEELLADYRDFLRQHDLPEWGKDDPCSREIRKLAYFPNRSYSTCRSYFENSPPEIAANVTVCLICQATYLLDRLKKRLEENFLKHGGVAERMLAARLRKRREQEGQ